MRKLLLLSFLFFTNLIFSQQVELIQKPGNFTTTMVIDKNNPAHIYSAGILGSMFESTDGGESISPLETELGTGMVEQIFLNQSNPDIIYQNTRFGYFYSKSNGETWVPINTDYGNVKMIINPLNNNILYIIVKNRELHLSIDAGEHWQKIFTFPLPDYHYLYNIAIAPSDTSIMYASSGSGGGVRSMFWKSSDAGFTWEKTFEISEWGKNFNMVQLEVNPYNPNSIYAVSGWPRFLRSYDGGKSFVSLDSFDEEFLHFTLDPADTNTVFLTHFLQPDGSIVHKTTDNGVSWNKVEIPEFLTTDFFSTIVINPHNSDEFYFLAHADGIYKTIDGGATWQQSKLMNATVDILYVPDTDPNYMLLKDNSLDYFYSENGGESWNKSIFNGKHEVLDTPNFEISVNPFNKKNILLGGRTDLFESQDEGKTWTILNTLPGAAVIYHHPTLEGVLFGGAAPTDSTEPGLYRSLNYGQNWEYLGLFSSYIKFNTVNPNLLYSCSYYTVSKSTDLGESWELIDQEIPGFGSNKRITSMEVVANNPDKVYLSQKASGDSLGHLWMSTNGGGQWLSIDSSLEQFERNINIDDIYYDQKGKKLFVGCDSQGQPYTETFSMGGLYVTDNDGKSWIKIYNGEVYRIFSDKAEKPTIYFNTKFGLMRFKDTTFTSVEYENNNDLDYSLAQNYPNPFNPTTNIKYSISKESHVKLEVYNILGEQVKTLINEVKQPGNYEMEFNGSNLPSGVYFISMRAGDYSKTIKSLLVK